MGLIFRNIDSKALVPNRVRVDLNRVPADLCRVEPFKIENPVPVKSCNGSRCLRDNRMMESSFRREDAENYVLWKQYGGDREKMKKDLRLMEEEHEH